ncbi:MAG: Hpt domain-containing protein, partial [Pseudomonadota bacterium]
MTQKPTENTIPVIDWELGLKLAGNKPQLAKDIMAILINTLPHELQSILEAKNDPNTLLQRVHKLHGAISYCGLPRLKKLLAEFEQSLKNEQFAHLDAYLATLQDEVNQVLNTFAETNTHD